MRKITKGQGRFNFQSQGTNASQIWPQEALKLIEYYII